MKSSHARGLCPMHYRRQRRHGNSLIGGTRLRPFDEFYIPEPNTGCWLWLGTLHAEGYGNIKRNRMVVLAHRYSWVLHNGAIPGDLCVLHRCDTRSCVNPSHLFLGTRTDNQRDMVRKGRSCCGERNGSSKLTPDTVIKVRAVLSRGRSQRAAASDFGVSQATIWQVASGKTWLHV